MNRRNIQAVTRKEYYHLVRDFRSLYLAFVLPLVLILLFGYALSLDVNNIRAVVVDYDKSNLSRDLIGRFDASPYFEIADFLGSTAEVTRWLDHGWAVMALVIPARCAADLRAGRAAQLQVILDGSDPNTGGISRGYVMGFIEHYNRELLSRFLERQGRGLIRPAVDARIRVWFNENLESRNFVVPGIIAVIIMIVAALLTSLVIAREYENGTMETILSLPLGAGEFLVGKAIPYFMITLTDVFVAILMGQVLFGVVMKSSFWLMVLATAIYIMVALSLGLLISIGTKSQLVANQIAILITYMPSLLLSDFVFPIDNMPPALQNVAYLVPAKYYIDILNGLYLRGVGLEYLWPSYIVLAVFFVAFSAAALRLLKKAGM